MNIIKEKLFAITPQEAWHALTDPAALSIWFMETNFKAELGYSFFFRASDGVVITGEILEIVMPKRLVYSWKRPGLPAPTTVTWSFLEMENGTLVRLEHDGFDDETLALFNAHTIGWEDKFRKLDRFFNK